MTQHRPARGRLAALLVIFVLGAWLGGVALPPFEGGDEWLQLAYIEHLRATGTLPDRAAAQTSPVRQQSGQPPLTYALSALPPLVLGLPPTDTQALWRDLQAASNNWFAPPDRFNRTDNNNVFYTSNRPANTPATVRLLRVVRLIAPLWGVIGVMAAYAAAREALRDPRWALAAAGAFAFTPTYLHINSFPNTDGGAAALATIALWLALRAARRGVGRRWAVAAGTVLGLAGLAKVSAVLVGPAVGVGWAVGVWRGRAERAPARVLLTTGPLLALPVLLTFGGWVLWGLLAYGDPLGTGTHRFEGQVFDPPLGPLAVLARTPEVYLSYWGKFASAVYLHPMTYAALTGLVVLALLGAARRRSWGAVGVWAVIWTAVLVPVAGLWYWLATINFITGRLLFPAHAALMILLAAGGRSLAGEGRFGGMLLRAALVGLPMWAALVAMPTALRAAYRQPLPPPAISLTGPAYDFDETIRLRGWAADDTTLKDGELWTVTLCWEVLAEPTRPAAYSLRVARDGVPVAQRTTVHGLGRYDWRLWTVGTAFCDALDVPVRGVAPGETYDLVLVLLDATTGAVDWEATTPDGTAVAFPVLGMVQGG